MTDGSHRERRSGWGGRLSRLAGAGLVFLSVSGLVVTFGPFHAAVQWALVVHAAFGLVLAAPLAWYAAVHWLDYRRFQITYIVLLGYVAALALAVCVVSGLVVTWQGVFGSRMSWAWRQAHLVSTFAMLGAAVPTRRPPGPASLAHAARAEALCVAGAGIFRRADRADREPSRPLWRDALPQRVSEACAAASLAHHHTCCPAAG